MRRHFSISKTVNHRHGPPTSTTHAPAWASMQGITRQAYTPLAKTNQTGSSTFFCTRALHPPGSQ
eukprot:4205386-Lingulodinium_polyedra.AAC.1